MTDDMNLITIRNCNNISSGNIKIKKNCLNIRFAPNGTGKSTIAKALSLSANNKELSELHSYGVEDNPELITEYPLGSVYVFDENFVDSVVFVENEIINNSFEVFIKTPEYDNRLENVNERLKSLIIDVGENEELRILINNFSDLSKKIQFNTNGELRNNPFLKSIVSKQHIYKIPKSLIKYKPFFESNYSIDWIDWKNKGYEFDDIGDCPFCADPLLENHPDEKNAFTSTYTKSNTKNLVDLLTYFRALEEYIASDKYQLLNNCIKSNIDENDIKTIIGKFIGEINFLNEKIGKILSFDAYSVKREEIKNLENILQAMKINPNMLDIFQNDKTISIIKEINSKIDLILIEVNSLKKEIGELNGIIHSLAKETKNDINGFLESAGINYEMDIEIKNESESQTILKYIDRNKNNYKVEDIKNHLSWGERNAFALVLFMHFAVSQNADLIILDDPISSFDNDKKYAIVNRLFKNSSFIRSFHNQSVLMMTHDLEPIIDFIVTNKPSGGSVCANYLQNKRGVLSELCINSEDLQSQVCLLYKLIKDDQVKPIFKVVALRKYIEITHHITFEEENAYNLISSLLKRKSLPCKKISRDEFIELTEDEISSALIFIKNFIPDFSYQDTLKDLVNSSLLAKWYKDESCRYFKIQLLRLLLYFDENKAKIEDQSLLKFIDETYHIENDYLYNLDFRKFNLIPDYIINSCDDFIFENYKQD